MRRRRYIRRKPQPTRPSMLDPVRDAILVWLGADAEPVHRVVSVHKGDTLLGRPQPCKLASP